MTNKTLFIVWGGYCILCLALSAIPAPQGALYGLLMLIGLGFFVPGGVLLYRAGKAGNKKILTFIRNLSFFSLVLTVVALLLNFASPVMPSWAGDLLYVLLVVVSVPMICTRVWILSLLMWAVFLMTARHFLKK